MTGNPHDAETAEPRADAQVAMREQLGFLWQCACALRPEWRWAYLLNLPSAGDGSPTARGRSTSRGEIEVFPAYRIASIAGIGRALALSADQYRALFVALDLPADDVFTRLAGREPLYALWPHLPLPDKIVGAMLGKTGGQVLGLRKLAVRQIGACLAEKEGRRGHVRGAATSVGIETP